MGDRVPYTFSNSVERSRNVSKVKVLHGAEERSTTDIRVLGPRMLAENLTELLWLFGSPGRRQISGRAPQEEKRKFDFSVWGLSLMPGPVATHP